MKKDLSSVQEELRIALEGLNAPEDRKRLTLTNLSWLLRNLPIQNDSTPKLKQAMTLLVDLLRRRREIGL